MLQMWQGRAYHQRLQRKADNEKEKGLGRIRQWRWEERGEFWQRSQVGMVQEISHVKFQNKYIIPNYWNSERKWELNVQADVKTNNRKKLKIKALVNSECTHIRIDKQLVKDRRIQMKLIDFSFEVFNADRTKNREVTKVAPLEIEINRHKETLEAVVTDLNSIDMFLSHDWLVKHNPEVNWKNGTIRFTRCPESCTI